MVSESLGGWQGRRAHALNSSSSEGETQITRAGPPMHNMAPLGMVSRALLIETIGLCSYPAIILNHAAAFVMTAVDRP